jgi:eukaryotic-like serine/threonine-protein kinase
MLKFITHRPLWANILAALGIAVILVGLLVLSLQWCTHHGRAKTVPQVVGKSFEQGRQLLEKEDFDAVVQDSVYVDSLPPLAIVKQIPEADAVVKVNRTVYLTINQAQPPMVSLPPLINFTYRNAVLTLSSLGLVADSTHIPDFARDNVKDVLYHEQTISPGTKLPMGARVTLVLGSGVGQTVYNVPNLIGLTYGEAKMKTESVGINLLVLSAPGVSDSLNAFIVNQDPKRFDGSGQPVRIRSGQMISISLAAERPLSDSTIHLPQ